VVQFSGAGHRSRFSTYRWSGFLGRVKPTQRLMTEVEVSLASHPWGVARPRVRPGAYATRREHAALATHTIQSGRSPSSHLGGW
jgi:hypothetical protein